MVIKNNTFIIGILCIVTALLLSGCCGAMNVQKTNTAIDSWNNLVVIEKGLDSKSSNTLTLMNDHTSTYNSEISRSSPNYDMLINNYQTDLNNLNGWSTDLSNLNTAISDYSTTTAGLTGSSKQDAQDAAAAERTYYNNMQNAQASYETYCNDIITYLRTCQNGNPDSTVLQAANSKKDEAGKYILNAASAAGQANDAINRVGK